MRKALKTTTFLIPVVILTLTALFFIQNCTRETIVIYKPFTEKVTLLYPPSTGSVFDSLPAFFWQPLDEAVLYQIQLATDDIFRNIVIDVTVSDTTYASTAQQNNGFYYWRVRAKNSDDIWGDWSEAMIWSFKINNSSEYIGFLTNVETPGTARDVIIENDIAYIADGHALLTIIDVTNPAEPALLGNIDRHDDDYAKTLWSNPEDSLVFIADADGKIMTVDIRQPFDPYSPRSLSLGWDQNHESISGIPFHSPDTVYLFAVYSGFSKRFLKVHQVVYDDGIPRLGDFHIEPPVFFSSDPMGVCFDSIPIVVEYKQDDSTYYEIQTGMFVFCAVSQTGLSWINVSETHNFDGSDSLLLSHPKLIGSTDTPSIALSVFADNGYVYVADDYGGLQVFDLPDTIPSFDHQDSALTADPVLIGNINTSGRTKDVHVAGEFCYLADGSGGLKVIDISNPGTPSFLAAYSTPYAYGVWADENYIYITDRDLGLVIFEKR